MNFFRRITGGIPAHDGINATQAAHTSTGEQLRAIRKAQEVDLLVEFRKSSYSSLQCVEVGRLDNGNVAVRNSWHIDAEPQIFTLAEWSAFVAGVKDGEFDFELALAVD